MALYKSGRFWLAGPIAFLLAMILMLGMAIWFPKGVAQVNNMALPMVFFPLIWSAVFFFAYLSSSVKRVAIVFSGLFISHFALLTWHFLR